MLLRLCENLKEQHKYSSFCERKIKLSGIILFLITCYITNKKKGIP
jgi:hypothetical protein